MVELETKRLYLRGWQLSDSWDMYQFARDPDVGPRAGWPPHESEETSKAIIKEFIQKDDVWALVLKETQEVVGSLGLHSREDKWEIGYVLHPRLWGKGLIPEALDRVIEYAFEDLKLPELWCCHYQGNHSSKRVIEKCGFDFQFTKVKSLPLLNQKQVTAYYYKKSP